MHPECQLSYRSSLKFLHNIRAHIAALTRWEQDNIVLRGDVVVDETLWTHDEDHGFANNWSRYNS